MCYTLQIFHIFVTVKLYGCGYMQAATEIVNPANILGEDAMLAEKWMR